MYAKLSNEIKINCLQIYSKMLIRLTGYKNIKILIYSDLHKIMNIYAENCIKIQKIS